MGAWRHTPGNPRRECTIMSLFQTKIEPHCTYCVHGHTLTEEQVACPKKGIMAPGSSCRSFKYDPLKRVPPRPVDLLSGIHSDEDFSL